MRLIIFTCLTLFLNLSQAFALSDAEYQHLIATSPKFKVEDENLSKIWKEVMSVLNDDEKKKLRIEQRQWLKSGLDDHAKKLMGQGISKGEAYAEATLIRVKNLRAQLLLAKEDLGNAKADDYDNTPENTNTKIPPSWDAPIDDLDNDNNQIPANQSCPIRARWEIKRFVHGQVMMTAKIYYVQSEVDNVKILNAIGNRGNTQNYLTQLNKKAFPQTLKFGQECPVFMTDPTDSTLLELSVNTNMGKWDFKF